MALVNGAELRGETGVQWTVEQLLGSGGQGEVYRVQGSGQPMALKWYHVESATPQQRQSIASLVHKGPPSDRFLWPLDLVDAPDKSTFGYVMPLRPPQYVGIADLMKRRADPSFRALITACFELAHHFMILHTRGLSYRDISFGNVFLDPSSGEIRIADNDNVCENGSEIAGVAGTPKFMAPEIVRSEARPSTTTDLFSLSVLLFYLLFMHHPLEGAREANIRCLDLPAMNKLYGTDPLFIFDPSNPDNRPVRGYQDNAIIYWDIYPQFIRDLFTKAFIAGLQPEGRVRESEWRRAMVQLRDSIIYCPKGHENFYDRNRLQSGQALTCWDGKDAIALPPRLKIADQLVLLTPETTLAPHHLNGQSNYDFSKVVARVQRHPTNASIWGLKNESDMAWTYTNPNGELVSVPVGKSVTLSDRLSVNFGAVTGEVRV